MRKNSFGNFFFLFKPSTLVEEIIDLKTVFRITNMSLENKKSMKVFCLKEGKKLIFRIKDADNKKRFWEDLNNFLYPKE